MLLSIKEYLEREITVNLARVFVFAQPVTVIKNDEEKLGGPKSSALVWDRRKRMFSLRHQVGVRGQLGFEG